MRKDSTRLLYEEELQKINREIVPKFGVKARVESGSYTTVQGGKKRINITVGETNTYKSAETLRSIGEHVKKVMEVNEVYSFGAKLA